MSARSPNVIDVIDVDRPQTAEVDPIQAPVNTDGFGNVIDVIDLKPEMGRKESGGTQRERRSPLEVDHVDHTEFFCPKVEEVQDLTADLPEAKRSITGRSQVDHIDFTIPIRTYSANHGQGREHWGARLRRVRKERTAVALLFPKRYQFLFPLTVRMTRLKPRGPLLDDDNLRGALKAVRDEVALQLHVDDGSVELIQFTYAQEKGPWGVRIQIEGGGA